MLDWCSALQSLPVVAARQMAGPEIRLSSAREDRCIYSASTLKFTSQIRNRSEISKLMLLAGDLNISYSTSMQC